MSLAALELPFNFEIPLNVWYKSGEAGKERRIGGIISTESPDRQNEVVLQNGLDFTDFIKHGWINDNHSKDTTGIVGYPTSLKRISYKGKPATYFEGYLLKDYPRADAIWKLGQALQKTNRNLGFSVEGTVLQREGLEGEIVTKAKVKNVAITNCPVNADTRLEILAKSLAAMERAEQPSDELKRSLMAGQGLVSPGMPPIAGDGSALRPESLERRIRRKKKIKKSEAIHYLKARYPGLRDGDAQRIVQFAAKCRHR
jgi:hypothetical protein